MANTNPSITVAAPTRSPRRGGLYSVAEVIDEQDASRLAFAGTIEWDSLPCGFPAFAPGLCFPDAGLDDLDDKAGTAYSFGQGKLAAGYYGVECFLGPNDTSEQESTNGLIGSEERLLEHALADELYAMNTPTDPASAASLLEAIAAADSAADTAYAGLPVIWMSRANAVRAAAEFALFTDPGSGLMFTANGTPVISSTLFDDGYVWFSGAVTVWRTPVHTYLGQDLTLNKELRIAERVFGIGFDCLQPTAIQITPPDDGGGA